MNKEITDQDVLDTIQDLIKISVWQEMIDYCTASKSEFQSPNDNESIETIVGFVRDKYPHLWDKLIIPGAYTPTAQWLDAREKPFEYNGN